MGNNNSFLQNILKQTITFDGKDFFEYEEQYCLRHLIFDNIYGPV